MRYRRKLPVGEIISRVFTSVRSNVWPLIRLGLPVIVVGLLGTLYYEIYEPDKIPYVDFSPIGIAFLVLNIAAYGMAIVGIHQVFLLPPGVVANTAIFRWTPKESRWFGWSLLIFFWIFLLALIPSCVANLSFQEEFSGPESSGVTVEVLGWLLGFFIGYFMARWSLIFPSVATDGKLKGPGDAWDLSRGNAVGLFILVGVIPMVTSWTIEFLPSDKSIFLSTAVQVVGWVVATLEIGLLSHSYAFLTGDEDGEAVSATM